MARVFDRQPSETNKAYTAFCIYRDMGLKRSIESAWKQYIQADKRVSGYFAQWSVTYDWVERARAYDDYIEAAARKKVEGEAIARKAAMLRRHADLGRALQHFGAGYIQKAKAVDKSQDAIVAIRTGVEMERKAEGLPEWILEVVNADDNELVRQYADLLAQITGHGSGTEAPGDRDPGADLPSTDSADESADPDPAAN